jgi:hypothetical protein
VLGWIKYKYSGLSLEGCVAWSDLMFDYLLIIFFEVKGLD